MALVGQMSEEEVTAAKAESRAQVKKRVHRFLPLAGCGLLVISGVVLGLGESQRVSETDMVQASLAEAQASLDAQQLEYDQSYQALTEESLGVNFDRKAEDDRVITQVLSLATTWDSGETYNAQRQKLIAEYGIAEDSQFITRFMADQHCKTDSTGQQFCSIDTQGLNSRFDGMESVIAYQESGTYHYTGYMTVSSGSQVGEERSERRVPIRYGVNPEGKVVSLEAYTSAFETDTSK